MCKYRIELWSVYQAYQEQSNVYEWKVDEVRNIHMDNLVDVLRFLKANCVYFENLNSYQAGDYDLSNNQCWWFGSRLNFANVYLRDKLLKFYKAGFRQRNMPTYTACGYKIKKAPKTKRLKHVYKNPKHPSSMTKDYYRCVSEVNVLECSEYIIPNSNITKLKKKPDIKCDWYLYEKVRSRNSMSWKNQKKKSQWM